MNPVFNSSSSPLHAVEQKSALDFANLLSRHLKAYPSAKERAEVLERILSQIHQPKRGRVRDILTAKLSEVNLPLQEESQNRLPSIIHRCYLTNFPPFRDPYLRFLETWRKQMPGYNIMLWGAENVDFYENEWTRRSYESSDPVFISEYVRWKALCTIGGLYLDADCEITNGAVLQRLLDELNQSDEYDAFVGVEEFFNGHPTAQTVASKPGSQLSQFMVSLYNGSLSGSLWHWRSERGLIGPQLMSLYFRDRGLHATKGFPVQLKEPVIVGRVKIYPQEYFSPKFATEGKHLRISENTCVYHLFANENVKDVPTENSFLRSNIMSFSEYIEYAEEKLRPWKHCSHSKIETRNNASDPYSLKKLHRIYFGFDGKPDPYIQYLQTWQDQLPEYEICLWDSSNLPLDTCEFTRIAYSQKDHAFLSDYFRWWVLREFGGVYLDADIEVTNGRIFDQLINELDSANDIHSFIGIDSKSDGWFTAHSMASKRSSELSRFMCEVYENIGDLALWRRKVFYFMAPQLTALYFCKHGINQDGMGSHPNLEAPIVHAGVKIYPQDWFSPMRPHMSEGTGGFKIDSLTDNTCICHHFSCSWHDADSPYKKARDINSLPLLADLLDKN